MSRYIHPFHISPSVYKYRTEHKAAYNKKRNRAQKSLGTPSYPFEDPGGSSHSQGIDCHSAYFPKSGCPQTASQQGQKAGGSSQGQRGSQGGQAADQTAFRSQGIEESFSLILPQGHSPVKPRDKYADRRQAPKRKQRGRCFGLTRAFRRILRVHLLVRKLEGPAIRQPLVVKLSRLLGRCGPLRAFRLPQPAKACPDAT